MRLLSSGSAVPASDGEQAQHEQSGRETERRRKEKQEPAAERRQTLPPDETVNKMTARVWV